MDPASDTDMDPASDTDMDPASDTDMDPASDTDMDPASDTDIDRESEASDDSDVLYSELEWEELLESLELSLRHGLELLNEMMAYNRISSARITANDWQKAESNQKLGYNGLSGRTRH
ncbi:hypothetical protein L208DRAFT_1380330 [Tricholoma matsutake]|nr:hypothetical protein L208DRAFT_1380330 [Tricholoma matsutake 945]